jgi:IS1 family transposase
LKSKRVQIDEIWAFCAAKQKNVATMKAPIEGAGDIWTWTWTAIDADSKLMISYAVGGRDAEYASAIVDDLASRIDSRIQLTTDGHKPYLQAIEGAFGCDVDYAMLIKMYGAAPEGQRRYSPAECAGIKIEKITGNPEGQHISTSYVERSNLSIRMHNRRHTRLTNAFSKKAENHLYAQALYFMFYNFVRMHKTLRMSPAMAAGISAKLWELADIVALIDARADAPKRPANYQRRMSST